MAELDLPLLLSLGPDPARLLLLYDHLNDLTTFTV